MKLKFKIPYGWSRLPVDCVIKTGDKFPSAERHEWITTSARGSKVSDDSLYIRKKTTKRSVNRKGTS